MAEEKMTLTQAHGHLVNFMAAFQAAAALLEAAETVLETVKDPSALEQRASEAERRLEQAEAQLSTVLADISRAVDEHSLLVSQLALSFDQRRDEMEQHFRREQEAKLEQARQQEVSDRESADSRRAALEASLVELTEKVEGRRRDLREIEKLVATANAELESVRRLVGPRER
jgi:chromosome segregation ATPase